MHRQCNGSRSASARDEWSQDRVAEKLTRLALMVWIWSQLLKQAKWISNHLLDKNIYTYIYMYIHLYLYLYLYIYIVLFIVIFILSYCIISYCIVWYSIGVPASLPTALQRQLDLSGCNWRHRVHLRGTRAGWPVRPNPAGSTRAWRVW